MKKTKNIIVIIVLIFAVAAFCAVIAAGILTSRQQVEGITNAEAAKMIACALESPEVIKETYGEGENWYDKYISYVNDNGFMNNTDAVKEYTYGDLMVLLNALELDFDGITGSDTIKKKNSYVLSESQWFYAYEYMLTRTGSKEYISYDEITIVGTPANVDDAMYWTAYTDNGEYTFEGLNLDGYVDNRIQVMSRDKEIITVITVLDTSVEYKNVWVAEGKENQLKAYIDGIYRNFNVNTLSENVSEVLADIYVTDGNVTSIDIKTDTIRGKVIAITDSYVELEGFGKVELDPDYRFYKNYGGFAPIDKEDILVGYSLQDFIVADGKVCGAVVLYPFEVEDIRILIKNNGFESIYHDSITVASGGSDGFTLYYGALLELSVSFEPGEEVVITPDSEYLKDGRIKIVSNEDEGLTVASLERAQGKPVYPGTLEIDKDEKGLYLVNETNLEAYLALVVPSEMPVSYGLEALKVQAVCARSYAYIQLLKNAYSSYGAHVDDSTSYQVYNNVAENKTATQAVADTCGQVVEYNSDVVETFYYSTSCGHSSDITVWNKEAAEEYGYLYAHTINSANECLDLTTNEAFSQYIHTRNSNDYDFFYTYYRWNAVYTLETLNAIISENMDVGEVTSVEVTKRLAGGCVDEITIKGTKGEEVVSGEINVRRLLGSTEVQFYDDWDKKFQISTLPSAFFALEPIEKDGVLTGYTMTGGGYGHGVGMGQNAAYSMTKEGMTYDEILAFFYRDTTISEIY